MWNFAANEAFEKIASYGILPNMILYLMGGYGMELTAGSNFIFFWNAATNITPVIGAFLSDSYLGRFWMIGFGSIISVLVLFLDSSSIHSLLHLCLLRLDLKLEGNPKSPSIYSTRFWLSKKILFSEFLEWIIDRNWMIRECRWNGIWLVFYSFIFETDVNMWIIYSVI